MPNRLATAASPYLLQHAHNPVDWYPWGAEALDRARASDRPILLSIGYAACHWCHVMERESFEDPTVAARMNAAFVNIKVDREERPDLDDLYMRAVQAVQRGHGGWPMTVFLTPDGRPFWGGTYFPPEPRHGSPSFTQLLDRMATLWRSHRGEVERVANELTTAVAHQAGWPARAEAPTDRWLADVVAAWSRDFDPVHGAATGRPKFPPHGALPVLLAAAALGDAKAATMATTTLDAMAMGGIYDHLAGGFCRYAVDESWTVPHFEKMLYDQAELVHAYVDGARLTGSPTWARVARETAAWVLRDLALPGGGLASSLDADTDGVEGATNTWTPAEVEAVLGRGADVVNAWFDITPQGNFEHGRSVPRLSRPLESLSPAQAGPILAASLRLLDARSRRPQPARDDKAVAAWNARMGSALCRLATVLGDAWAGEAALGVARFLDTHLTVDGVLMRSWCRGTTSVPGFADDHAARAIFHLDLFELTGDRSWLDRSLVEADDLLLRFGDGDGLRYTANGGEALVAPVRNLLGGAEPGANGLAALLLTRLAAITGRDELGQRADRLLALLQPLLRHAGRALGPEALAGAWRRHGGVQVVVVGPGRDALVAVVRRDAGPTTSLLAVDAPDPALPLTLGREADHATAWVCFAHRCSPPTQDPARLAELLVEARAEGPAVRLPWAPLPETPSRWIGTPCPAAPGRHLLVHVFSGSMATGERSALVVEQLARTRPDLAIAGVHVGWHAEERPRLAVLAASHRLGLTHPILVDDDGSVRSELGTGPGPSLVHVDPGGFEVQRHEGLLDLPTLLGWFPPAPATGPTPTDLPRSGPWASPTGLELGEDGVGWVANTARHEVVEFAVEPDDDGAPALRILRVHGGPVPGRDDGLLPRFCRPTAVLRVESDLFVADTGNDALRRIDLRSGRTRTAPGGPAMPAALAGDGHAVYVAAPLEHRIWTWLADRDQLGPYAGTGQLAHVDGATTEAALAQPQALAADGDIVFFADGLSGRIRAIDLGTHEVATVACHGPDGTELRFASPTALLADGHQLLVADALTGLLWSLDADTGAARTVATALHGPRGLARWGDWVLVTETDADALTAIHLPSGRRLPVRLLEPAA